MNARDRFFHTRHGRMHALEAGSGHTVILGHTLGGSAYQFEGVIPRLAEKYSVLALDMIGYGDSDPLIHHLSMEQHAEAIVDVIDQLGRGKVSYFGQSIGGYLAAALAARWPDRLEHSIIGEAPPRTLADYVEGWFASEQMVTTVTNTVEEVSPRFRNLTPQVFKRWNIDRNKAGAKTLTLTYWAIREFDFAEAVKQIEIPAMVVLGENSLALQMEKFRSLGIDRLPIKIMKNCGHFLSIDDPDELFMVIDGFVR